jgi:hypothetical protein
MCGGEAKILRLPLDQTAKTRYGWNTPKKPPPPRGVTRSWS